MLPGCLAALLALAGCSEAKVEVEVPLAVSTETTPPEPEPEIVVPAPVVTPDPEPEAPPPEPPPPAPDPEALARARDEAARLRFEREHPLHGVSYHFLAQVHERPDRTSRVVGYMRRGAQFRAREGVRGPGCSRTWHEVPGGGFVCRGQGFALGDTPQTFEPSPVGPALDDALPYVYAWVSRNDVPQYWRLPTPEEEALAARWISKQRESEARTRSPAPSTDADQEPEPGLEAPPGLNEEAGTTGEAASSATTSPDPSVDAGVGEEKPSFLRMRMRRGFYVSLDRLEVVGDRRFYRTIRGGYVPADALVEASPPEMRGVVLGGRWSLPLGFVFRGGVRSLTRNSARGVLEMAAPIETKTPLPLSSEIIERQGRRYRVSDHGAIVREDALRIARQIPRPSTIPDDARWIHVDLAEQVVVAYEGDRPVFATLTSTGRAGHETPTGTFRVQSKHVSGTMDDLDSGADSYSIEDVPWTMYFEGSYAIHGAFWHDRFGRPRSHGCVNLAPVDARWIFQWSAPMLGPGWHGLSSQPGTGTFVHVTSN